MTTANNLLEFIQDQTKLNTKDVLTVSSALADPRNEGNPPITFSNYDTLDLFPPLTQAYFKSNDVLEVKSLILIPEHENNNYTIEAVQQFTLSDTGEIQLNIFITYKDSENKLNCYVPYMVTLELSNSYLESNGIKGNYRLVKTVKTFLINLDPVASRGTVTTVKPTTNPTI